MHWIIYQILASQLCILLGPRAERVELMHSSKMYPPRFTLQVHGQNATHDAVALVEFKGACMDLSTEIYLNLPAAGTKYPFFSFVVRSRYIASYPGSSHFSTWGGAWVRG